MMSRETEICSGFCSSLCNDCSLNAAVHEFWTLYKWTHTPLFQMSSVQLHKSFHGILNKLFPCFVSTLLKSIAWKWVSIVLLGEEWGQGASCLAHRLRSPKQFPKAKAWPWWQPGGKHPEVISKVCQEMRQAKRLATWSLPSMLCRMVTVVCFLRVATEKNIYSVKKKNSEYTTTHFFQGTLLKTTCQRYPSVSSTVRKKVWQATQSAC